MIPTRRALWLWGASSLLFVGGFLEPALVALGVGIDLVVLGLVHLDSRAARQARLRARRELPDVLHQCEPAPYTLRVENADGRPWTFRVRDALAPELGAVGVFDLVLPAHSRAGPTRTVTPLRRGPVALAPAVARVVGPRGLGAATVELAPAEEVRVWPQARFTGEEGLFLRRLLDMRSGAHLQARLGVSTELHALREYHWGDDLRRVHWKQTARLRRPIVAETTWEQHQSLVILLDAGRPMAALTGEVPKLDRALAVVLALLRVAARARDTVHLVLFSREIRAVVRVNRNLPSYAGVYERLHAEVADTDEPDYGGAVAWAARNVPRRSLVLLCTSVGEALAADRLGTALRSLGNRHRPVLVNLEDPGLVQLARSVPDDVVGAYAKLAAMGVEARNEALGAELRAAGIDVVSTPAEGLLTGVLQAWLDQKAGVRRAG